MLTNVSKSVSHISDMGDSRPLRSRYSYVDGLLLELILESSVYRCLLGKVRERDLIGTSLPELWGGTGPWPNHIALSGSYV